MTTSAAPPADEVLGEIPIVTAERSRISSPIGWASILGATAIAIGVWLLLHLFGVGVGLTAIDPGNPSSLRGAGIGVGVWSLLAPIIAIFIGGLAAGRLAPTINTMNAAIHGAVVWALGAIAGLLLLVTVLGAMIRGITAVGSGIGSAATSALSTASSQLGEGSLSQLGITGETLIAPINARLQARGMPPVQPENVAAAAQEALERSIRQGGVVDRETLVAIVAERTALSREDASQIADTIVARWSSLQPRAGEVASGAATAGMQMVEATGKLLLGLSLTLTLALAAALAGAVIGVRHERREHVLLPRATSVG